jgi:hypothetical protein
MQQWFSLSVTNPQINGMAESFVKTLKRDYGQLADWPKKRAVK